MKESNGTIVECNGTIVESNGTIVESNGTIVELCFNGKWAECRMEAFKLTSTVHMNMLHYFKDII